MQSATGARLPDRRTIERVIADVSEGLVERDAQARCLVLAALCGEHVLFVGPPGTAKSELARRLHRVIGGRYFERLLTRFTVPEELFGPLSLAALDAGRYERDIDGYLPTASIAFLDEVFKANSAILNALLTLLNEREFDQGAARIAAPLVTVVAASNEVPDDETLRAFFDRFLFRCAVAPVSDDGFERLLDAGGPARGGGAALDVGALAAEQAAAGAVRVPGEIVAALRELRAFARGEAMPVSDRRWVRIVRALRVAAAANGRDAVALDDLWIAQFLVCENSAQAARVEGWFAERLGAGQEVTPERLARVVQAFEKQIELERSATELAFDDSGKLALVQRVAGADADAMSGAAPRMSAFSRRKRFSATHIRARMAQIDAVLARVDAFAADANRQSDAVVAALAANLWVAAPFRDRVRATFASNLAKVLAQRADLQRVRDEYAALPLADVDDGIPPEPVEVVA
ncbi:MAG: AAA family ATPase [Burkholderiaceae bacterium]